MTIDEVRWFRVAALAEAVSWTGLLIGMIFKYLVVRDAVGVHVFGPIHGALFLGYSALAVLAARRRGWSRRVGWTALAAGVPPFGTVVFERWATRRGVLPVRAGARSSA